MRERLEERLATLKSEYDKGQNRSRLLEGEITSLRETMLRISGAILVIEELLSPPMAEGTFDSGDRSARAAAQAEPPTSAVHDGHAATKKEL